MNAITQNERLLTPKQAAFELGLHASSVRRAIKAGEIQALQLGTNGHYRIRREALDEFLHPVQRGKP